MAVLALLVSLQVPAVAPLRTAELLATVRTLAADELGGRPAGSWEALAAARLLAFELERAGCQPVPATRDYLLPLLLQRAVASRPSQLTITRAGQRTPLALDAAFRPLPRFAVTAGTAGGAAVFVGYGIHAPDQGWDDYQGLPPEALTGRTAVLVASRPRAGLPDAPGKGQPIVWRPGAGVAFSLDARVHEAARRGASLVVLLTDPRPQGLQACIDDSRDLTQFVPFVTETLWCTPCLPATARAQATPAVQVLRLGAEPLFGGREALAARLDAMDRTGTPGSGPLADTAVTLDLHLRHEPAPAAGALGLLPGRDPQRATEFVLVTAHLDGTGRGYDRRTLHPGANDGASGCAALAALAAHFAAPEQRPRRSLVFVAWSGRDRGLLGSSAWVQEPPLPLAQTRAVVHLDGIGRAALRLPAPAAARQALADTLRDPGARIASDTLPFLERGVPALRCDDGATPRDAKDDTAAALDPGILDSNVQALVALVRALADAEER